MGDANRPAHTTFLSERNTENEIKKLVGSSNKIRVAVAYWGADATERLGVGSLAGRDVIVICDLMSGACNPNEIAKLQGCLGRQRVLMRDRLHAKVWLTEKGAIVGSSNASTNGLGFERDELRGSIEGNVFTDDPSILIAIDHWLEKDVISDSREITPADIKEARKRWKSHRATRPPLPWDGSLLDALRTNPSSFADRDFFVWVYADRDLPPSVKATVDEETVARKLTFPIYAWYDVEGPIPSAGAYVLDFNSKNASRVELDGLYQVLGDDPLIKRGRHTVLLCRAAALFNGLKVGDRRRWEQAATRAANNEGCFKSWNANDFAREFLISST